MMKPSAARQRGHVRKGPGLSRSTRYHKGDTRRGRARVPEGEGQGRTLFTTAEAAAQLGITHDAVKMAVRVGTLPVERINPRLNMITAEAIEAYRRNHLGREGRPKGAKNKPKASASAENPSAGREDDV